MRSGSAQLSARRRALLVLAVLGGALLLGTRGAPSAGTSARSFLGGTPSAPTSAEALPSGFHDEVAFSGLTNPTSVRFASDGRIFVAEKSGLVKVFDSLSDPTPTVAVDLRSKVDDYWDRGLLGLALDPGFPASPFVYLLYTYDAPPGGTAPVWNDGCPTPPGPTTDGCVVSGTLVRVTLSGDVASGPPQTLIAGEWCQQYPSHSVGDLAFGPDGKLYASGGDGASFIFTDYGQGGGSPGSQTPKNPCDDPPAGVGGDETAPTAQGGSLRSQSPDRPAGPTLLNGTVIRVDPATGAGAAGNPFAGSGDADRRRIIAYGLRNPFRFAFRPGTSELWVGDVGWDTWEEIERRPTPTGPVQNFGWPCYEGTAAQPAFQAAGLAACSSLYAAGSAVPPYYAYAHADEVVPGDNCPTTTGSVVSGLAFYEGGSYPASYDGALVFADHSRNCIWAMGLGPGGAPDPSRLQVLETGAAHPVDVETGPGGDLYYVDFDGGTIHHISYSPVPPCPTGQFRAEYRNNVTLAGEPVLTRCEPAIDHDWASGSPAPEVSPDNFSARWTQDVDLAPGTYTFTARADDGIRLYVDDSLLIDEWIDQPATTYTATTTLRAGAHQLRVEYYDHLGDAVAQVSWSLDTPDAAPSATIDTPSQALTYAVGQQISFSGHATDPEQGPLPASALSWTLLVHHCTTPTECHVHTVQAWNGAAGGTLNAPDHAYPSHLELVLHATDDLGATSSASVTLDPRAVDLAFRTSPAGLTLSVGSASGVAPFARTVIVGSQTSISAPAVQAAHGTAYHLVGWSDGGTATHNITAPARAATYTATYAPTLPPPPASTGAPTIGGRSRQGTTLTATAGAWTGARPITFAYTWLRCDSAGRRCAAIAAAAGPAYTPSAFDIGSRLAVLVTATNAGGSASARSGATAVVAKAVRGPIRARAHRARPRLWALRHRR